MTRQTAGWGGTLALGFGLLASCGRSPEAAAGGAGTASPVASAVDAVRVVSQMLSATVTLPGELQPYQAVTIYPKVTGFVKSIAVDRGSHVKRGDVLAQLEAPELAAQRAEAQAKLLGIEAQLVAAQAKLAADTSTYEHLKSASASPGVVAGNDLVLAQKSAEASQATVKSLTEAASAGREAVRAMEQAEAYLTIEAPFDGVVTERNVHPGDLVGPASGRGAAMAMLRIETVARLRLVVPVPEAYAADVPVGTAVGFTVPGAPGEIFRAPIARVSHAIDVRTRTMPVELEVTNAEGRLTPGAFAQVEWPIRRRQPTLFVPSSSITTNLERTFVIRIQNGQAEWVDVKPGVVAGTLTEVFGDVHPGDVVVARATDAVRPGAKVSVTIKP